MNAGGLGSGLSTPGADSGVFSDAVHRDWYLDRPATRLDMSPAFRPADEALLLLFPRLGGRVLQAVDLIKRLASLCIGVDEPAHAIMRAAGAVPPPVDALFWMFAQGKFQENAMPLSGITGTQCAGLVPTFPRCIILSAVSRGGRLRHYMPLIAYGARRQRRPHARRILP